MVTVVLALCLAGPPQGGSLLHQVVPNPTGKNGYEEYLRAAEIVSDELASTYLTWRPGLVREFEEDHEKHPRVILAKRLDTMSVLEVRKEAVARYGEALKWVKQGNSKPVFDPRTTVDVEALFPELSPFRNLGRLAVAAAYVHDAEGRPSQATDALLDTLILGDNIAGGPLLANLVGTAIHAIALAGFETRLDRMSAAEAGRVASVVAARLSGPPKLLQCLEVEARIVSAYLDQILNMPQSELDDFGALGNFSKLSARDRAQIVNRARERMQSDLMPILARLKGPESGWVFDDEEEEEELGVPETATEIVDALASLLTPHYGGVTTAAARSRTQLRLLRLAARVIAFKWEHDRLPPTLEHAAPADEIADTLTGEKFQFAPMSDRFRVFSRGVSQTGEIDIRYQRPRGPSEPPPP